MGKPLITYVLDTPLTTRGPSDYAHLSFLWDLPFRVQNVHYRQLCRSDYSDTLELTSPCCLSFDYFTPLFPSSRGETKEYLPIFGLLIWQTYKDIV